MHPGRVDVIGGGALVLRTLVERTGAAAVVASEHDILDGIALSIAERCDRGLVVVVRAQVPSARREFQRLGAGSSVFPPSSKQASTGPKNGGWVALGSS